MDACTLGSVLSTYETIAPFSERAAEQRDVDVSIRSILAILLFHEEFLQIREDCIGEILYRIVHNRFGEGGLRNKAVFEVYRVEHHYYDPKDEEGDYYAEQEAEGLVEPSQHRHFYDLCQSLRYEDGKDKSDYQNRGEGYDADEGVRDLDIRFDPRGDDRGEVEGSPYTRNHSGQRDSLLKESFWESADYRRDEADEQNDVKSVHCFWYNLKKIVSL